MHRIACIVQKMRLFTVENPNFVVYMEYIFGVWGGWGHWHRTPTGESYAAALMDP